MRSSPSWVLRLVWTLFMILNMGFPFLSYTAWFFHIVLPSPGQETLLNIYTKWYLFSCSWTGNDHGPFIWWCLLCWHWYRPWAEVPQRCRPCGILQSAELHRSHQRSLRAAPTQWHWQTGKQLLGVSLLWERNESYSMGPGEKITLCGISPWVHLGCLKKRVPLVFKALMNFLFHPSLGRCYT